MKYLAFFAKSFKSQFVYRNALLFQLLGSALGLFIEASLWTALLGAGMNAGATLPDMLLFVIVNMLMQELTRAHIASMLEPEIRDGSAAMHFIRPVSFKYYCLSTVLGQNAYYFLTTAVPLALVALLFFRLPPLGGIFPVLLFLITAILGIFIILELSYCIGLLAFFTQKAWYFDWYLRAGKIILGGTAVPIWFYPRFLDRLSILMPFRYVTFEPINILLGRASFAPVWAMPLIALLWILLLALLGEWIFGRVVARLTVNGG